MCIFQAQSQCTFQTTATTTGRCNCCSNQLSTTGYTHKYLIHTNLPIVAQLEIDPNAQAF